MPFCSGSTSSHCASECCKCVANPDITLCFVSIFTTTIPLVVTRNSGHHKHRYANDSAPPLFHISHLNMCKYFQITGNTFQNNVGAGVIRINANSTTIFGRIENNVFCDNSRLRTYDMKTIYMLHSFDMSLANNMFSNPNAAHEIRVPTYLTAKKIDASGCYWGVKSYANIISR